MSNQPVDSDVLMSETKIEFATTMFKLLGHPLRLRIVEWLDVEGEKTVNEIAEAMDQPQSTVSLYLNKLKGCGLLRSRRDGIQSYYSTDEPKLRTLLDCLRGCPIE
jgi:DNA-binding transcriptional ArsR family regulator